MREIDSSKLKLDESTAAQTCKALIWNIMAEIELIDNGISTDTVEALRKQFKEASNKGCHAITCPSCGSYGLTITVRFTGETVASKCNQCGYYYEQTRGSKNNDNAIS